MAVQQGFWVSCWFEPGFAILCGWSDVEGETDVDGPPSQCFGIGYGVAPISRREIGGGGGSRTRFRTSSLCIVNALSFITTVCYRAMVRK